MRPLIHKTIRTSVFVLLVVSFLNSTVALDRRQIEFRDTAWRDAPLPNAALLGSVFLGYNVLAADLAWSWTVIENAEAKRAGRTSHAVTNNVQQIVALDPKFYPVYEWFSGAFLMYRWPVTAADLDQVSSFIDLGIAAYPQDWYLPFSAALNFIGYSARHTREERAAQNAKALEYLRSAATKPGAKDDIAGMILYFENRGRRMDGKPPSRDEQAAIYFKLLQQTTNPTLRESLLDSLKKLGIRDDAYITALFADQHDLELAAITSEPYLPLDFWLTLQ